MAQTSMATDSSSWEGSPSTEELEQRVQRLEDVVAALCDNHALEERISARVTEQLARRAAEERAAAPHQPDADAITRDTAEGLGFADTTASRAPLAGLANPSLLAASLAAPEAVSLLGEMWTDLRTLWRMIRDPFYRMTWMAKIIPAFALLYVTVWSWLSGYLFQMPSIPVIGFIDDLAVLYLGFKVLGRELRRYREFLLHRGRY